MNDFIALIHTLIFYVLFPAATICLLIIAINKSNQLRRMRISQTIKEINESLKDEDDLFEFSSKYQEIPMKSMPLLPSSPMERYLKSKIKDFATLTKLLIHLEMGRFGNERREFLDEMIKNISGRVLNLERLVEIYIDCLSKKADGQETKREEKFILAIMSKHVSINKDLFREKVITRMTELIESIRPDNSNESLDRQILLRSELIGFKKITI